MTSAIPSAPARTSLFTHVKRAFSWNLGRVVPSEHEAAALAGASVTDPVVQRYAAWRRSLLFVALVPTLAVFLLAVLDLVEGGTEELSLLGIALELAWVLAMAGLAVACVRAVRNWTQPGAAAGLLRLSWMAAFLLPLVYALLPDALIYDFHTNTGSADGSEQASQLDRIWDIALSMVLSSGVFLQLLPAILAIIPGSVNGCLRVKSLLPAAQLPGWLMVCAAPLMLLFWSLILVVANQVAQSPLLACGIVLWAGSPIWYALRGRVFVQAQLAPEDVARIGSVKRVVAILGLAGIALMATFALTTPVVGLTPLGLDPDRALSPKIDELVESSDDVSLDDVGAALEQSDSILYAYDLSSWQLVLDILAKLLLATAVFADLVLRATLAAWRNDRALRGASAPTDYDTRAAAASAALALPARSSA